MLSQKNLTSLNGRQNAIFANFKKEIIFYQFWFVCVLFLKKQIEETLHFLVSLHGLDRECNGEKKRPNPAQKWTHS
jgi:hypothetical protein